MYTRHAIVDTRLGAGHAVASDDSMVGLELPDHWYKPADDAFGAPVNASTDALLAAARSQLDDYLDGARTSFDLPTTTQGDPFQERVWALLKEIPFGETTTYGKLAGSSATRLSPGGRAGGRTQPALRDRALPSRRRHRRKAHRVRRRSEAQAVPPRPRGASDSEGWETSLIRDLTFSWVPASTE